MSAPRCPERGNGRRARRRVLGALLGLAGLAAAPVVEVAPTELEPTGRGSVGVPTHQAPGDPKGSTGLPAGGPDVLHWPLATSPALENVGVWRAEPILVSGASAYRSGEFLYQDHLYDDLNDGATPYPDEPATYGANAADFVEVRVKPLGAATAIRITYNTLLDPEAVGTTVALGDSSTARQWPHAAGVTSPAELFVTVHGEEAVVVDAATGEPVAVEVPATVDLERRQVELRVPYTVFDPRGATSVRIAAATGVWDRDGDGYASLHNVAFRYDETEHPGGVIRATWFRDTNQAAALEAGDISAFAANVDFAKLAARVDDDMEGQPGGVPVTGSVTRIYVSHFSDGQGRGTTTDRATPCDPPECSMEFRGDLQPYWLHIPATAPMDAGYGLTVFLHGCGNNQHEMFGTAWADGMAGRGPGTLVIGAGGRGRCLWYQGAASANIFEIWADLATRYALDPTETAITGYSMGGFGTFSTASLYPELWGGAIGFHPCSGTGVGASEALEQLPSVRHVPFGLWYSVNDPLCQPQLLRQASDDLDAMGYENAQWTLANDHFTDMSNDAFGPAFAYLAGAEVTSSPSHVTYVVNPDYVLPRYGLNADHAYWVSGLRTRDGGRGTIDVVTHGLGVGDPALGQTQVATGLLTGGTYGPLPYVQEIAAHGPVPPVPVTDRLEITATNIAAVSIDPVRAGISCDAEVDVTSDGALAVTLIGCP